MAKVSEDFLRFLKANYTDDWMKVSGDNVPDNLVYTIQEKHEKHYKIWQEIPEWIKNEYGDVLPREVFNGNIDTLVFLKEEERKQQERDEEIQKVADYGVKMLALGFTAETVAQLSANYAKRLKLLSDAHGAPLSAEAMSEWLKTREDDQKFIEEDWKNNQSEKYIVHLLKKLNRNSKQGKRVTGDKEQAALGMARSALEREIADFMHKFEKQEDKDKLLSYLKQSPQKAALRHLSPEVLVMFKGYLEDKGIKLDFLENDKLNRDVVADNMKEQFNKREDLLGALCNKYAKEDEKFALETFEKSKVSDMGYIREKEKLVQANSKDFVLQAQSLKDNSHQA